VWPKLSAVMHCILDILSTETSSERVFSLAGRTVEERRTQLSADAVDDLVFVHTARTEEVKRCSDSDMTITANFLIIC